MSNLDSQDKAKLNFVIKYLIEKDKGPLLLTVCFMERVQRRPPKKTSISQFLPRGRSGIIKKCVL